MEDKRSIYRNHFNYFVSLCMSTFSVGIAIYAIYITGGEAMTHPLPPIVWGIFAVVIICFFLVLYNWIMMMKTPKDTRLDDLIKDVKELKPNIDATTKKDNLENILK